MNTAVQVIQFPKPQSEPQQGVKGMYSDRFQNGYVMSSRLYREEVRPFLTDAARNVYAELEDCINGHNKESDFVSYSQLQGGNLPDSRKLSRGTVADGVEELIEKGVISIISTGPRGVKKYKINEISLIQQSTSRTGDNSEPVQLSNRTSSGSAPVTSSGSELTIDNIDIIEEEEEENAREKKFEPQNRSLGFIEFHIEDRQAISLRNLFSKYPTAQVDFYDQAKISFPNHTHDQILAEIKKLAQWSLSASNHMPQKWMSIWLNWMQKVPAANENQAHQSRQDKNQSQKPEKKQRQSRFGKYLKSDSSPQKHGEIYDV